MDTQGRFSGNYTCVVVRPMDEKIGYSEASFDVSLRLPVFQNIRQLFSDLENRLMQLEASQSTIEDCRQNAKEVEVKASQNLLVAIEFYRGSEYIRVLEDMIAVSGEMLDTATTLDGLGSVLNWSTSLAIRALGFALEAGDNMKHGFHDPQNIEYSDNVWKAPDARSENLMSREWVYAC